MTDPNPIPPGLVPAMNAYLEHLVLRGRILTARSIGQALTQFLAWLVPASVDPLLATAEQLAAFQSWLVTAYRTPQGKPLAKTTCSTRLAQIQAWYRWAYGRGLICIDPSRSIGVHVPRSRVVVREHLTLQEATALVQTQAGVVASAKAGTHTHAEAIRNLAAICLSLATGRRIGGMTTLQVADLDIGRRELRVEREKGATGRVLPMAAWAVDVLAIYLREARPTLTRGHDAPWLFLNMPGDGPITREALRWMLEQLVIQTVAENPDLRELPAKRITWHSLRVSYATMLFSNGCDIRSVNELLLHRRLSTTARYTPIPIEDLRQVFRSAHPRP
jgi:integrase/recombinase XerD